MLQTIFGIFYYKSNKIRLFLKHKNYMHFCISKNNGGQSFYRYAAAYKNYLSKQVSIGHNTKLNSHSNSPKLPNNFKHCCNIRFLGSFRCYTNVGLTSKMALGQLWRRIDKRRYPNQNSSCYLGPLGNCKLDICEKYSTSLQRRM